MRTLSIDIETYSSAPLNECGVYKYAESEDFTILLFAYSFDDDPVRVIDLASGEKLPQTVLEALIDSSVQKWSYNAQFERVCLSRYLKLDRFLDPFQWFCTMGYAAMLGLPGSLDLVGQVLHLNETKLKAGRMLISYFCQPCNPTKTNGGRTRNLPAHDLDKWNLFKEYNAQDVRTEREVYKYCRSKFAYPRREHHIYAMDQFMNDRGVLIDLTLINSIINYNNNYIARLISRASQITKLDNPNSVAQLKNWLSQQGFDLESLNKETVKVLLDDDLPSEVVELLQIRQEMSMSSIKKYDAIKCCVCSDNRIRGMLQYYGANRTGRWAGRLVQLQNLKRNEYEELDSLRDLIKNGNAEDIEMLYDGISEPFSQLVRTAFIASEGKTLCIADYSAIEARVIAWLANETWKLELFQKGGKLYESTVAKMFNVDVESITHDSPLRKKGKVAELACGYGGSVGALKAMGALSMGLTEDELPTIVSKWRTANPRIVKLWADVEERVRYVIQYGYKVVLHHGVEFEYDNQNLYIKLPTGRKLTYFNAEVGVGGIKYRAKDQKTGRWGPVSTFGGKLVENIVQSIARDCLAESMLRLEDKGYPVIFHVHDEVIVEGTEDQLEEIMNIMAEPLDWAPGLYLPAAGYCSPYYKKD